MKKLNNKGFAISTVIYGIAIMGILLIAIVMAEMATIRSNTRQLSKSIEEDLNSYSRTANTYTTKNDNPPSSQEYIVPAGQAGWYRIELWGSQNGTNGGYGAYTSGVIELEEGDILYFYIGKAGSGRETDVRVVDGDYTDPNSYQTRIMVAAGGGQSAYASGGTLKGYTPNMRSFGGFISSKGNDKSYKLIATTDSTNNTNGTLVGYKKDAVFDGVGQPSASAIPSPMGTNGGGDGYNPGTNANQGGASYIAGYAGVAKPNVTVEGTKYYFVNGVMIPGVNQGAGKAKIERIAVKDDEHQHLEKVNTKLESVRKIRDCINTTNSNVTIKAISAGNEVSGSFSTSGNCATLEFSEAKKLDEIAVFHQPGADYLSHTIQVSSNGTSWTYIKNSGSHNPAISETETPAGIHISAYQYDSTGYLPDKGNYYIIPVLSENKVITAAETTETSTDPIGIKYLNGESTQKWSVELIKDKKVNKNYVEGNPNTYIYKITELARYKSLEIHEDENISGNQISTGKFNNYSASDPQIWKIIPVGDGTYIIKTIAESHDPSGNSGYMIPQTNNKETDNYDKLLIGKNENTTARFKLIAIDNSSK